MNEETKITHESLDNLNEAIKSNIGNDNKPTKFLNVSGVYKYNNVNYTRPLRTDKYGNLKIANDSTEAQEVTNPTLTNLNSTIKNNAVTVNVNNLDSLSISDEFLEKQNLSAFQDVSKEAQKLRNDASTFPKLLVHNVRPETTPVVNQTDINNDIIPLNCNVDNTIESGEVIKPLQSTIRALPGSAAEDSDVKVNPNNVSRNEIMADLNYENALQTVDQNLKTVLGTESLLSIDGNLKTEDQRFKIINEPLNLEVYKKAVSVRSLKMINTDPKANEPQPEKIAHSFYGTIRKNSTFQMHFQDHDVKRSSENITLTITNRSTCNSPKIVVQAKYYENNNPYKTVGLNHDIDIKPNIYSEVTIFDTSTKKELYDEYGNETPPPQVRNIYTGQKLMVL